MVTRVCKPLTAGASNSAAHQLSLNMSSTVTTALGADSITVWTGISTLMSVMYSRLKRRYSCQLTKRAADGSGSSAAAGPAVLYSAAVGEGLAGVEAGVAYGVEAALLPAAARLEGSGDCVLLVACCGVLVGAGLLPVSALGGLLGLDLGDGVAGSGWPGDSTMGPCTRAMHRHMSRQQGFIF